MTIDPLNLPKEYYRRFFVHHALYKIFDKKTSVEDRTQLTTTAKSCISDGQLKTLLSTIHQTPIIFYLSCLFFEWEIHEDGNGATTKKGDKDMSKFYIQTESMYIRYDEFPLFLMLVCTKKSVMHMHIFIANKLMRNSKVRSNYWILFQSTARTNTTNCFEILNTISLYILSFRKRKLS